MVERVLVCGSREWPGTWEDIARHLPSPPAIVMHGACSRLRQRPGSSRWVEVSVDMLADHAAERLGLAIDSYPVDRAIDGPWPAAGPRRNARMMRGKPDRGLAFGALWKPDTRRDAVYEALIGEGPSWRGTGTGDMVRRMLDAGLPVRWIAAPGAEPLDLVSMPEPPR